MKKTFFIVLVLLGFFVLCEIATRMYEKWEYESLLSPTDNMEVFDDYNGYLKWLQELGFLQESFFDQNNGVMYTPFTGGGNRPNYHARLKSFVLEFNSFGFRSEEFQIPKPKGVFRIFILGGSTVVGGFNDGCTISHHLQEELGSFPNVEVINAGVVGYSSINELTSLETKLLQFDPDMVIILDGRNDLYYGAVSQASIESSEQKFLDAIVNKPTFQSITTYVGKLLVKKSHFLRLMFHILSGKKFIKAYPEKVHINEASIQEYVDRLRLMEAILESKKIAGIIAFQPTLGYGKEEMSPFEASIVKHVIEEEKTNWLDEVKRVWPRVGQLVKNIPPSNYVKTDDFSTLFDKDNKTIYMDSCHYDSLGAKRIATALRKIIARDFGTVITRKRPEK